MKRRRNCIETMQPFGLTKCATIPFKTYYFTFALVLKVFLIILSRHLPEDGNKCGRISYVLKAYYCNIRYLNVYKRLLFPSLYRISSMLGSRLFTIVAISSECKYADVTLITSQKREGLFFTLTSVRTSKLNHLNPVEINHISRSNLVLR
jgi:hypothetical protein